jgi:hypothetical protein
MQLRTFGTQSKSGVFLLLFLFFFCIYTLTSNGAFRQDDEHILAARTQSLALWGQLSEPQVYGNQRVQALIPLGDAATQVEFGQAVLGAIVMRGAQVFGFGGAQSLFTLNTFLTALCGGIVFLIATEFKCSRQVAIWCAVLFGIGSMAWPYAMTYFRDTLAMTMSAVVFLGWARLQSEDRGNRCISFILIGLGLLGGVVTKNNMVVLVVALSIVVLISWMRRSKTRTELIRATLIGILVCSAVLGLVSLMPEEGPFARFSLAYYYSLVQHFRGSINVDLLKAIAGPLLSPGKSLLLYSPPLLLGLIFIRRIEKSLPRNYTILAMLFTILLATAQGCFYRERWAGGFGWGLKYMLPALPAIIPMLASGVASLLDSNSGKRRNWLWVLLLVSVLVQLSAVLVPWNQAYDHWHSQGLDPYSTSSVWKARFLAIPGQLTGLFSFNEWGVVWQRLLPIDGSAVAIVAVCALFLAILSLRCLLNPGLNFLSRRRSVVFILSGIVVLVFTTWWAACGDPAWGDDRSELHTAFSTVTDQISENEVVLLDSYGTTLWYFWINRWNQQQRWYSLPFSIGNGAFTGEGDLPVSAELEHLILEFDGNVDALWYVTSGETADYVTNPDRRWLESQLTLDTCMHFGGDYPADVCRFILDG